MTTMKKTIRESFRFLMIATAIMILFSLSMVTAFAAPAAKASYEGKGRVEIDFTTKVQYRNSKITVKDNTGKSYAVTLLDRDNDDLEFRIKNYKTGRTYTYKITGVRARGESKYSSITGTVKIPKETAKAAVKKVEYDRSDRELSIDLTKKVTWKNPVVKITSGTTVIKTGKIEFSRDDIEINKIKLTKGQQYQYSISGIISAGTSKTYTLTGTFTA